MTTLPEGWFPADAVAAYNPNRYDFDWNEDYTAFRPIRLRWWDDASYAAYQAGDLQEDPAELWREAVSARLIRKGVPHCEALKAAKALDAQGSDYYADRQKEPLAGCRIHETHNVVRNLNRSRAERGAPAVSWIHSRDVLTDDNIPF